MAVADNGNNPDQVWVEHPMSDPPHYPPVSMDYQHFQSTLDEFERLMVQTQSCRTEAMRWLVAMHEGLFPYIRDAFPARFILVHIGPSQSGKTSGAQRFTLLQGLGPVTGDFSVAALGKCPIPDSWSWITRSRSTSGGN
jgi:hypothetical protein